ncbi:type III-B CRISPR-associated protein Cas10/Cmr2 [Tuwongella immobilis]|uniref:GGDEF domain-containing protein n=1 Tax=Tuwongella immobilis TaxID=692036 RepID=A0A6C2YLJ3_9BACT|nr:type III-B CRISPR-associated protein Cas10/Cmr2 [Tuwongella immobilis]VIP02237.1 CRISPR-associated protein, Crm2 family OS=Fretibacterium fastidiosum GN=SY1_18860 PE=4 SV=1: DUF3692 [Tuwongella immobilis]VTS00798.1 CRISPR-associated protein, Crm2 family OS=Fretibacterium fastidiosum GN=SY1_18860 PE=4 SV=1: DUF3692 [Tuwongella immobilis]
MANKYLLTITVGPVQEFISAARRTRDLWFGSMMLSEISAAVAHALLTSKDGTVELIFPNVKKKDSSKLEYEARRNNDQALNVANIILAEVTTDDVATLVETAKKAAKDRWKEFANGAWAAASGAIRSDVWDNQIDDVLELFAVWVPHENSENYPADRKYLNRLLAGRKNLRDFAAGKGVEGLLKSSLDGQRETVLFEREKWPKRLQATLRIKRGEQLDIVGLVKRTAGGTQAYPSVSSVAVNPWVRGRSASECEQLTSLCETLVPTKLIRRTSSSNRSLESALPFEGTAFYTHRHHELIDEYSTTDDDRNQAEALLQPLKKALARLPEPQTHVAVLLADGDKMGAAMSLLKSAAEHRKFSADLASFADYAAKIVKAYHGVLIYAGGDDVLAILPVDTCVPCAKALSVAFTRAMQKYDSRTEKEKAEGGAENKVPPTLSVGIGIGHFMDNLEDLLDYARKAEKLAKNGEPKRNGLAVYEYKRGGAPIEIRSQWSGGEQNSWVNWAKTPNDRLMKYVGWILDGAIPMKLPYDLRNLVEHYRKWERDKPHLREAFTKDTVRVIHDKQPRTGNGHLPEIAAFVGSFTTVCHLDQFAKELLVAKLIADGFRDAGVRDSGDLTDQLTSYQGEVDKILPPAQPSKSTDSAEENK